MTVLAGAALLPTAGGTSLAPHPSTPQGRDGGAFGGFLTQRLVEGGAQTGTVKNRGRRRGGLVP